MKKYLSYGWVLIAMATIAFGTIGFVTGHFHEGLFPVSASFAGKRIALYILCALLVLLGTATFFTQLRYKSFLVISGLYLLLYLIIHLYRLLCHLHNPQIWAGSTEVIGLSCGALFAAQVDVTPVGRLVEEVQPAAGLGLVPGHAADRRHLLDEVGHHLVFGRDRLGTAVVVELAAVVVGRVVRRGDI